MKAWSGRSLLPLVLLPAVLLLCLPLPAPAMPSVAMRPLAWLQARVLAKAGWLYHRDQKRWPRPEQLLGSLPFGDLLDGRDPWQQPFGFRALPDDRFEVRSRGPDGLADTDDDVVVTVGD